VINVLDRDLRYALSPVELFTDAVGKPDKWQAEILDSLLDDNAPRQSLLLCSRGSGKSEICACAALWTALYQPGSLTLLCSVSLRQSSEIFRKVARALHAIGGDSDAILQESALKLELRSGSRVISLPGSESTSRGYHGCTCLIFDEIGKIPDEMVFALLPSQATAGPGARLFACGTPAGKRGFLWNEWDHGVGYARYSVKATDVPRIPASFLKRQMEVCGAYVFAQEYENVFCENDMTLISDDLVKAAMVDTGEKPWW